MIVAWSVDNREGRPRRASFAGEFCMGPNGPAIVLGRGNRGRPVFHRGMGRWPVPVNWRRDGT